MSGEIIYIGNLNYNCSEEELRELCEQFGDVFRVTIIQDHETGQSRGFAFVTYISEASAFKAITELNGRSFQNRVLKVAEAKPRPAPGR
jgi:RNA recognition motif-containing protein